VVRLDYVCVSGTSVFYWVLGGCMIYLALSWIIAVKKVECVYRGCLMAFMHLLGLLFIAVFGTIVVVWLVVFIPATSFACQTRFYRKPEKACMKKEHYLFFSALTWIVYPSLIITIIFIAGVPFNLEGRGFVEEGLCEVNSVNVTMLAHYPTD